MYRSYLVTLGLSALAQAAVECGFNYGATFSDGSVKQQSDFQAEFNTAKNLKGASGKFTSARLYTMIVSAQRDTELIVAFHTDAHQARWYSGRTNLGYPGSHR